MSCCHSHRPLSSASSSRHVLCVCVGGGGGGGIQQLAVLLKAFNGGEFKSFEHMRWSEGGPGGVCVCVPGRL